MDSSVPLVTVGLFDSLLVKVSIPFDVVTGSSAPELLVLGEVSGWVMDWPIPEPVG